MDLKNLITKTYVLYLVGLVGLFYSCFQLFREFQVEYVVGLIISISVLIADYFLPQDKKENNESLNLKANDFKSKKWKRFKWISFSFAILFGLTLSKLNPVESKVAPKYSMAFYITENSGNLKIVNLDSVQFEVSEEDLIHDSVRLPLQLAIRSEDDKTLNVVKVVLNYPPKMKIKSTANPLIEPDSKSIIYEHDLQTLEPTKNYTPIKTIDTLLFPFHFALVKSLVLSKDQMPIGEMTIYDEALIKDVRLEISVEIYCENRPVVYGTINAKINPNISIFFDLPRNKSDTILPMDREVFKNHIPNIHVVDQWDTIVSNSSKHFKYLKERSGKSLYQFIYLNGALKRVSVDTNSDGLVEYVLINDQGNSSPNEKLIGDGKTYMYDWTPNDLHF